MLMERRSNNEFLIGATLGCFVGAATALLFTPVSGRNLRRNILQEMRKKQHEMNGFFYQHPHRPMKRKQKKTQMKQHKRAKATRNSRHMAARS